MQEVNLCERYNGWVINNTGWNVTLQTEIIKRAFRSGLKRQLTLFRRMFWPNVTYIRIMTVFKNT